jgi:hypothetical protein
MMESDIALSDLGIFIDAKLRLESVPIITSITTLITAR